MSLVGERAENRLPEYAQVLQRVISSKDHDSFRVRLNDRPCVIFSSETSNRWYLILSVDTDVLYAESDRQMAAMGAINLLMLVVVLTCAVVSARSRQCAAQSVSEGTAFLSGLATQLRQLSAHILRLNDQRLHEEGSDPAELAEHLNRAVDQLSALSENVRSYAALMALRQEPEQPRSVRHKKSSSAPSRTARSGILLTLTISLVIILFFCVRLSANWGVSQLNRDADHYENHLNQWIARQESVLSLFTGLLSAEPELMDDHDKAVRLLDDMAKPHPDIAACYLANPYAEIPVIMSNGWVPDEEDRPENRLQRPAPALPHQRHSGHEPHRVLPHGAQGAGFRPPGAGGANLRHHRRPVRRQGAAFPLRHPGESGRPLPRGRFEAQAVPHQHSGQLRQVHRGPGSVSFAVEQERVDEDTTALRFTMADTGVGMDKEYLPRLFEAFSQEDSTATNRYGGSGLGMAITKRFLDQMGGTIEIESEKGVGSTFVVTVPLRRGAEVPAPSPAEQEPPAEAFSPAGLHVLVAEDNELNAEILMDLLDMEEITCEWADNGEKAVKLFSDSESGHFDAVLMDMRMPVMDGVTATRALRSLERSDASEVPIIALTANAFEDDVHQCLEAGMNAHLSKPVDIDLLIETLGKYCAPKRD